MSVKLSGRLVLVGAGKMGGALLQGWLEQGVDPRRVVIFDPGPPEEVRALVAAHGIAHNPAMTDVADAEVVLLAVKPQMMGSVLPTIVPLGASRPVFLSVAAGTTIATFERHLGAEAAIVRAMPNTPAAVGRGITVVCPNARASETQITLCMELLAAVGDVARVDDEALIDAVTAVSGSGPAYVFLLAEAMAAAGTAVGLPADLAARLARRTVAGAGELLHQSELPAATLRQNVTSPGGTTAAALKVLMADGGLFDLMVRAVTAARDRSRELAG